MKGSKQNCRWLDSNRDLCWKRPHYQLRHNRFILPMKGYFGDQETILINYLRRVNNGLRLAKNCHTITMLYFIWYYFQKSELKPATAQISFRLVKRSKVEKLKRCFKNKKIHLFNILTEGNGILTLYLSIERLNVNHSVAASTAHNVSWNVTTVSSTDLYVIVRTDGSIGGF